VCAVIHVGIQNQNIIMESIIGGVISYFQKPELLWFVLKKQGT
jgi:hypothetical protein